MPGIKFTKSDRHPLLAAFGVPVLTQAVWAPKTEPVPSTPEEEERLSPIARGEKVVQTEGRTDGRLTARMFAAVGRFPTKHATLLMLWGVVLVAVLPVAFASFGNNGKRAAAASPARSRVTGEAGSTNPVGPAVARTGAAPSGSAKEVGAAVTTPQREDQALKVLEALSSENFGPAEELATGPFLDDLVEKLPFVRGMDLDTISVVARGPGWARLEARYRPSNHWFEKQEEEQVLVLDLVEEEAIWKLEDLRVTPRSQS